MDWALSMMKLQEDVENLYLTSFLIATHFVVLEYDEENHKSYDKDCENACMVNIQQSLGTYTIFIRYTPDVLK
jgi:hypothetical protein